jgi:hypothetical protein
MLFERRKIRSLISGDLGALLNSFWSSFKKCTTLILAMQLLTTAIYLWLTVF